MVRQLHAPARKVLVDSGSDGLGGCLPTVHTNRVSDFPRQHIPPVFAMLTAKEAADRVGRTKAGILKAIKTGRLSAAKGSNGEWLIEPAELFRVYQPTPTDSANSAPAYSTGTTGFTVELAAVREKLATLEHERHRERGQLEAQIADLREDRDRWRAQAERAALLLTDQRAQAQPQPEPISPPRRGLRGWLHRVTA